MNLKTGECVNQVYEINADTWEDAKKKAFNDMAVGDYIAMCDENAVKECDNWRDYHYIDEEMCEKYARLGKGCWATYLDSLNTGKNVFIHFRMIQTHI